MKINLIPEVKKEQAKVKQLNFLVTFVSAVIGAIFFAVIIIFLIYIGVVSSQISNTEKNISNTREELKAFEDLEKTQLALENGVSDVKAIIEKDDRWEKIYESIEKATPKDIRFKSLNIDQNGTVTADLEGGDVKSIDRFIKSFSTFKDGEENLFQNVSVNGYSKSEKQGSVNFSAQFTINTKAL